MTNPNRYGLTAAFGSWTVGAMVIAAQTNTVAMWFITAFAPIFVGLFCAAVVKDERP